MEVINATLLIPVEDIQQARGDLVRVLRNYWWATTEDGRVAVSVENGIEHPVAAKIKNDLDFVQADFLDGEPVQISIAYIVHRCVTA